MEKNSLYKIVGLIYMIKRLFLMLTIISLSSLVGSLSAQTMDEALGDAVSQLRDGGIGEGESVEMVIEMANYHSKKFDREARVIQGGLYTALQAQFPKAKILLQGESITGVSLKVMVIRGTYKPEGERTYISLKAVNKMNGRMIAKADASYSSPTMQDFVAMLPDVIWELEAEPETRSGKRRFTFHRKADRKSEDEDYIGPKQRQRLRGAPR